ncbi:alanine aminotransferase 2-like [Chelonia mydas]|uniref:alanine aminotransferase 2-like n=1 Tax=Chelonia mydas TaxID=8469 RepID=UPI001CA90F7E|nr:alanine aminotransferase 2-like [Chelonia mydas]
MVARRKVLTLDSVNPRVKGTRLPTLGPLLERASQIQRQLAQGEEKPFREVIWCHSRDPHAAGRRPITFLHQVAAICAYPELLHADSVPRDAEQRASRILPELHSSSAGAYNMEYVTAAIPQRVGRYLERRDGGIRCDPSSHFVTPRNIVTCGGITMAIADFLSLVVNEQDPGRAGMLLPVPGHPLYADAVALAGAVGVPYHLDEEGGWALDVGEIRQVLGQARGYCTPKVLCVINPGYPTGQVVSRRHLQDVLHLAAQERLLLLADEGGAWPPLVHQDSVFTLDSPFLSFKRVLCELGPAVSSVVQLISFYSASKGFAAEGGFWAGFFEPVNIDPAIMKCFCSWGMSVYPLILGQVLLDALMEPPLPGDPSCRTFMAEKQAVLSDLAHKAQLTQEIFSPVPGIRCNPVQGAMYSFPRIQIPASAVLEAQVLGLEPDFFFCQKLLEATGIVLAPGSTFGQRRGTHHLRVTLLPPVGMLRIVLQTTADFHSQFLQQYS